MNLITENLNRYRAEIKRLEESLTEDQERLSQLKALEAAVAALEPASPTE